MLTGTFAWQPSLFCVTFLMVSINCVGQKIKMQKVFFFEGRSSPAISTTRVLDCLAVCVQHNASCQAIRYKADGQECHLLNKWTAVNVTAYSSDKNWVIYAVVVSVQSGVIFYLLTPYTYTLMK